MFFQPSWPQPAAPRPTATGGIAYNKDNRSISYATDAPSRAAAEQAALYRCEGRDCQVAAWFEACGALAVSRGGAWGGHFGGSEKEAAGKALEVCRTFATSRCTVRVQACNTR